MALLNADYPLFRQPTLRILTKREKVGNRGLKFCALKMIGVSIVLLEDVFAMFDFFHCVFKIRYNCF